MPEQDPRMQLLEQSPIAHFEPQLATQQHEQFNSLHNAARKVGAIAGATLALTGAAMADRAEGPLGTDSALAREVATKVTLPQTGINLAGANTKPATTKKRPLLSSFDLSKFPEGYFDNGVPEEVYIDCGQAIALQTSQQHRKIWFANKQKTKVKIWAESEDFQENPYCEALGDLTVKVWAVSKASERSKMVRNTPIGELPLSSKNNFSASTTLPLYGTKSNCELRNEIVQMKYTTAVPLKSNGGKRKTWAATSGIYDYIPCIK